MSGHSSQHKSYLAQSPNQERKGPQKKRMQKWSHKRSIQITHSIPKQEFRSRCIELNDTSLVHRLHNLREMQHNDYKSVQSPKKCTKFDNKKFPEQFRTIATGMVNNDLANQCPFQPLLSLQNLNEQAYILQSKRDELQHVLLRAFLTVLKQLSESPEQAALNLPMACSQIRRIIENIQRVSRASGLILVLKRNLLN